LPELLESEWANGLVAVHAEPLFDPHG
jgi:hypothetical protein